MNKRLPGLTAIALLAASSGSAYAQGAADNATDTAAENATMDADQAMRGDSDDDSGKMGLLGLLGLAGLLGLKRRDPDVDVRRRDTVTR